jgi:hypothetical protein
VTTPGVRTRTPPRLASGRRRRRCFSGKSRSRRRSVAAHETGLGDDPAHVVVDLERAVGHGHAPDTVDHQPHRQRVVVGDDLPLRGPVGTVGGDVHLGLVGPCAAEHDLEALGGGRGVVDEDGLGGLAGGQVRGELTAPLHVRGGLVDQEGPVGHLVDVALLELLVELVAARGDVTELSLERLQAGGVADGCAAGEDCECDGQDGRGQGACESHVVLQGILYGIFAIHYSLAEPPGLQCWSSFSLYLLLTWTPAINNLLLAVGVQAFAWQVNISKF